MVKYYRPYHQLAGGSPRHKKRPPSLEGAALTRQHPHLPHHRPKITPIHDHPALVPVIPDLAGHHLHRHMDLERLPAQVGKKKRAQKSSAPSMLYGICVGGAATSTNEPFSYLNIFETAIVGVDDIGSSTFRSA